MIFIRAVRLEMVMRHVFASAVMDKFGRNLAPPL
jgi:hypothetical protein